ncbi:Nuclear pore complex protein Nup98-Nup96 [Balamuthia mandrillaris]
MEHRGTTGGDESDGEGEDLNALLSRSPTAASNFSTLSEQDKERRRKEKFLVQELHIPPEWLEESKAWHARYSHKSTKQVVEHLMRSRAHWQEAHDLAVCSLAPDLILRGEHNKVLSLFRKIEKEAGEYIKGWSSGGRIFLEYATIVIDLPNLLDSIAVDPHNEDVHSSLLELGTQTERLARELGALWSSNSNLTRHQQICYTEMSQKLVGFMTHIRHYISPSLKPLDLAASATPTTRRGFYDTVDTTPVAELLQLAPKLTSLAIPENNRLSLLRTMCSTLLYSE